MGIDIYTRFNGMTKEEEKKQYTGFDVFAGDVGYLREAYHGKPYATKFLVREAFRSDNGQAKIPAKVLRRRLPKTLRLVEERERVLYGGNDESVRKLQASFLWFVEFCEKKEKETGKPVTILASY